MKNPKHLHRFSSAKLSRRHVLAASAIAAAASLPFSGSVPAGGQTEAALLSVLRHRRAANEVGHAVLSSWPQMCGRAQLLRDLLDDLHMDESEILLAGTEKIARRLSQRIREDFASQRTFNLDGWLVSLTELRLCALAALVET